jgi:Asp/Glu/hydantoin racemase
VRDISTIILLTPMRETPLMDEIVSCEIKILEASLRDDLRIQKMFLPYGPAEIVTMEDETAAEWVIKDIIEDFGQESNILVNCTADIGLGFIRGRVKASVGIGSAGFEKAMTMGKTFCIVVPTDDYIEGVEEQTRAMSVDHRVGGVFSINAEVRSFVKHRKEAVNKLTALIASNGILQTEPILLGCGTMLLLYESLASLPNKANLIEPTTTGLNKLMALMDADRFNRVLRN